MKEIIKAKLPIIIPVACGVIGVVLIAVALTFAWPSLFPAEKDATEPATTESSPISDNVGEATEPTNGSEASEPSSGGETSEPTNGGNDTKPSSGGEASEPVAPPTEPDGPGFVTDENGNDNYAADIF